MPLHHQYLNSLPCFKIDSQISWKLAHVDCACKPGIIISLLHPELQVSVQALPLQRIISDGGKLFYQPHKALTSVTLS